MKGVKREVTWAPSCFQGAEGPRGLPAAWGVEPRREGGDEREAA